MQIDFWSLNFCLLAAVPEITWPRTLWLPLSSQPRERERRVSSVGWREGAVAVGPPFWCRTAPGLPFLSTDGLSHRFWHCGFLCVPKAVGRKLFESEAVYRAILAILYFQHFVDARSKRNCSWGCLPINHATESEHIQMMGPIGTFVPCLGTVVGGVGKSVEAPL